jgi:hypothetical protein
MATPEKPRRTETSLTFNQCDGSVSISERVSQDGDVERFETIDLIRVDWNELEMGVSVEPDQDGILFALRGYHLQAEEGARVFHVWLQVALKIGDLKRLHSYLGFLIASGLDGIAGD